MPKKFFATVAAFVLVLTMGPVAPPASAANAVVEVPGHAGLAGAGLWYIAQRCDNPAAGPDSQFSETPAKDGGVRGTHALGWKYPTAGNEVGALGYTASPRTLSIIESYIKGANSPGLTGHAVAVYDDTAGGFTSGRWVGRSNQFALGSAGWVRVNAGTTPMTWYHYNAGGFVDQGPFTYTVKGLADELQTNGSGAYVGFAMGCNAEQFFMDALTVGDTANSVTYDYEGLPSASRLLWSVKRNRIRAGNFAVYLGTKFQLHGDSYDYGTGDFYVGQGTFFEKRYGSSKFVPIGSGIFDLDSYATYYTRKAPKRRTTYWFGTDGSNAYEGSAANTVTVQVVTDVRGRVLDDTLRPGQRAVVKGRLKPGNRGVKVSLQRKLDGRWTTVATTRSKARGAFVVGVPARSPGQMVLRLSIAKGKGNLGNTTNSVTVTVRPRPRPDAGPGNGAPTQSEDTSTDTGDDPPDTPPDAPYKSRLLIAKTPPQGQADTGVEPSPASSVSCAMPSVFAMGPCAAVG